MSLQREIAATESKLRALKQEQARQSADIQTGHDNMIGAVYHAIKAVIQIRNQSFSRAALDRAQSWSGSDRRFKADGDYNVIRRQVHDWLVELDFIDPVTDRFRYSQGKF